MAGQPGYLATASKLREVRVVIRDSSGLTDMTSIPDSRVYDNVFDIDLNTTKPVESSYGGLNWQNKKFTFSTNSSSQYTISFSSVSTITDVGGLAAVDDISMYKYIPASPTPTPTTTPTPTPTPTKFSVLINSANFNNCADWDGQDGNVTTVGSNGGPSVYGTFDQCGNLYEWNDLNGTSVSNLGLRGGRFNSTDIPFSISSSGTYSAIPDTESNGAGFRIASLTNPYSFIDFVKVGDANNIADTGGSVGKGGVPYEYYIQKYLVTNIEYAAFLNAIGSSDPSGLYSVAMSDPRGGIVRSGSMGGYSYTVKTNYERKPVNNVSWFNCARYANWLHNNKPTGNQDSGTTEGGAYTLNGTNSGNSIAKNPDAKYYIPTENEWYKAAFYKGGGTSAGYWKYATQSDTAPTCVSVDIFGNGPV